MSGERQLSAIVSADVVGFARLMGRDELATLDALRACRAEVIDPLIARNKGRLVKTTGDGLLLMFLSVTASVAFALDVQRAMAGRASAENDLRLRIGIHLGDVILDGSDIFDDGVNVAARLEPLAAPGGICLSATVREHVSGKLDIDLADGGEMTLKNIERPIHVWHWTPPGRPGAAPEEQKFGRWRPTIAVLPFDNISGDPEQDYFADGLTEDLITALTHWRSFPVVARNSTFTYKGKPVSVPTVARELGANYVVEGSVRKAGRRVRVTAQLVDGAGGHHIWAERYDRDLEDIFEVQDDLVHRISALLAPEVSRAELARAALKRPMDMDAWDHFLRGEAALAKQTAEGFAEAREHCGRAIEADPGYCDAYAAIAISHSRAVAMGVAADPDAGVRDALAAATRAVELDPASSRAHFALSTAFIQLNDHDRSLDEARLAVELNPNDPTVLHALGNKSDLVGDPQGIGRMEFAQKLNPRDPVMHVWLTFLARAFVNARDHGRAAEKARAAILRRPDYGPAHLMLAIALAHQGRTGEAAAALGQCETVAPGLAASRLGWRPYTDDTSNEHLRGGLRKAITAVDTG